MLAFDWSRTVHTADQHMLEIPGSGMHMLPELLELEYAEIEHHTTALPLALCLIAASLLLVSQSWSLSPPASSILAAPNSETLRGPQKL